MKKLTTLFLFAFMCLQVLALGKKKGLEIEGTVTENGKRYQGAVVHIYEGNNIVETFTTEKDGHFFYVMDFDKNYAIEVLKEGYVPKRMWFDTTTEFKEFKYEPFQCFVEITPEEEFIGVDISALDFPVAVVIFDKRVEQFVPKKKYAKNMRTEYNRLLTESAVSRDEE